MALLKIIRRSTGGFVALAAAAAAKPAKPAKPELTPEQLAERAERAAAARARAAILLGQEEIEGRQYALIAVPLHSEPVTSKSGKVRHVAQFSGYLLERTKKGALKRATVELEGGARPLAGSGNIYFSPGKKAGEGEDEGEE